MYNTGPVEFITHALTNISQTLGHHRSLPPTRKFLLSKHILRCGREVFETNNWISKEEKRHKRELIFF